MDASGVSNATVLQSCLPVFGLPPLSAQSWRIAGFAAAAAELVGDRSDHIHEPCHLLPVAQAESRIAMPLVVISKDAVRTDLAREQAERQRCRRQGQLAEEFQDNEHFHATL